MANQTPRWPSRHPLCTCPDWEADFRGTLPPSRSDCKGRDIAHPVLTSADLAKIVEEFRCGTTHPRAEGSG